LIAGGAACRGASAPAAESVESGGPGVELVFDADLGSAVQDRIQTIRLTIEVLLSDEKVVGKVKVPATPAGALGLTVADPGKRAQLEEWMKGEYADSLVPRECGGGDDPGAICMQLSAPRVAETRLGALKATAQTIRRRLEAKKIKRASVSEKSDAIVVRLPPIAGDVLAETKELIASTGKLELRVVDAGSSYMRRLFEHVGHIGGNREPRDPDAIAAGIRAESESWNLGDGRMHHDYYLMVFDREQSMSLAEAKRRDCWTPNMIVHDGRVDCLLSGRQVLTEYLAELFRKDPSYALPDDRALGFERVDPRSGPEGLRPYWRSHYLMQRPDYPLGGKLGGASASIDSITHQPIVLISFDKLARRVFADLTERIIGQKLAMIFDGRILSAPVIMTKISGGRTSIMAPGAGLKAQQRAADELALILESGPLAAPVRARSP
jgi:preprotein translocase subunit SecD